MLRYIEYFDKGVKAFPNRALVIDGDVQFTFRDMSELTHRIACGLMNEAIGKDEPVATIAPNSALGYACQWGIIRAGMPWLPVNIRNGLEENIAALNKLRATFLMFDSSVESDVKRLLAEVPSLRRAVCIDKKLEGFASLADWMPQASELNMDYHETDLDDIVSIPMTSGSTGKPKGVMLTNASFSNGVANFHSLMHYDVLPVTLAVAPMTHGAGYFAGTLIPQGGTIVMLRDANVENILSAIPKYGVTTLFLPPTLLYNMLAHPRVREFDYSSMRYIIMGAAPLSEAKLREAIDIFGHVFCNNYSQTEAPVTVTYLLPEQIREALKSPETEKRLHSVGTEAPFSKFAIMDDDGNLLGPNEPGEIVVRSQAVMKGYFEDPEQTAATFAFGWHHTGDIGLTDEDGYLYLVDRKKDMIISGGFNVYPGEVEQVIWEYPGVLDCAVVGAPDDKWGEKVIAIVQPKAGENVDADALHKHLRDRLGGVKAPKEIILRDELPRSANGKVLKREIRDSFWAGHSRRI